MRQDTNGKKRGVVMQETARDKTTLPALCGRRKQLWMSALSLLLILCLTACGGPEGGKGGKPSPESPDSGAISSTPPAELSAVTLGGTYWTAVQHESYDDLYDRTNVSQMPTDKWWADLFLNEDRTTQFREVLGDTFNLYLTDGLWSLEADGTLHLTDAGGNRDYDMAGRFEEGRLILETAYGDIFYLEQAERPEPGGELCPANLAGTWRMTGLEENGRLSDAREKGVASILLFSSLWSELDGGRYTLQADYYFELHPKSWTRKSTKGVQKSMGKELFSEELKLAVVQYVLEGHTRKEASEKFCVSCTPIEKWVNLYKLHGAKGLLSRNLVGRQKGFDGEFRLKVLQYKQEHHLSCTQTAMHFCLDVVTVCRWEKKFQKEGAQGLMKKQATKGSEKRQKKQEQSELQQENKRLSEENYRLKMENDYLKKLNALIQKREKPE